MSIYPYAKNTYKFRVFCSLVIIFFVISAIYSCKDNVVSSSEKNKHGESFNYKIQSTNKVVDLIRSVVIKQTKTLSNREKVVILNSAPDTCRYRVGLNFWEYYWFWRLPTGRTIKVTYTGFLESIDPGRVNVIIVDGD